MSLSRKVWLTFFTLVAHVAGNTLAAEGAPLTVTATTVATGRVAHVDTAAVCGQAAWRAGLVVSRGAQVIQLNGQEKREKNKAKEDKMERGNGRKSGG